RHVRQLPPCAAKYVRLPLFASTMFGCKARISAAGTSVAGGMPTRASVSWPAVPQESRRRRHRPKQPAGVPAPYECAGTACAGIQGRLRRVRDSTVIHSRTLRFDWLQFRAQVDSPFRPVAGYAHAHRFLWGLAYAFDTLDE